MRSRILSLPPNRKRLRRKKHLRSQVRKFRRLWSSLPAKNSLQRKARTRIQEKSASRSPTLLRRRTFRHDSIQLKITPGAPAVIGATIEGMIAAMTARGSITAVEATEAVADVGDVEAGVIAVAVHKVVPVGAIFRRLSMLRRKAGNFAVATTIAIAGSNAMTTAARKVRAVRAPRRPMSPRKRSFSRANRSQSIATNP